MVEYLAITCGGTGGHFYPGLSVARAQVARGQKVVLILSGKNSQAQSEIASRCGIDSVVLPYMPSPGLRSPGSCWRFLKGLLTGYAMARKFLRQHPVGALLGMGSFASLPAIWAAHREGIPIVLHDGNARIGKANRMLSRWAKSLGTAFPAVNADKVKCPVEVANMPLRPELSQDQVSRREAIENLNRTYSGKLSPERFTVLLFGGSQGARKLNEAVGSAFKKLSAQYKDWQLIHLTGSGELPAMEKFWQDAECPVLCLGSLSEMHWAYQASDVVIARSGGSSVAEINAFGKYAILIPYPFASEGHQMDNANYLAGLGAAKILKNEDLSEVSAEKILQELYSKQDELLQIAREAIHPAAWQGSANVLAMLDRAAN